MTNKRYAIAGAVLGALWASTIPAQAAAPSVYEWGTSFKAIAVVPMVVQTLNTAVQIDAGNKSDLAVLSDGTVWAWGATQVAPKSMKLVQVSGLVNVVQRPVDGNMNFAAIEQPGNDAACPASSSLYTWGLNMDGSLGVGVGVNQTFATPQDVSALDCQNVVQVAAGANHMVALTSSGQVYVWGGGGDDVLGDGSVKSSDVPVLNSYATALTGGTAAGVQLTAGSSTEGILVNGQAYSWGANAEDQCGCNSSKRLIATPTAVDQGAVQFTWIDQGGDTNSNGHTLALDASGDVYAWGDGSDGQLGQGSTASSDLPVLVPGIPAMVTVRAGGLHSLALDAAGDVYAWGGNKDGEVGDGTKLDVLSPIVVLSGVGMISAGSLHSLAL